MQEQNHYNPPAITVRGIYRPVPNVRYASHPTSISSQHVNLSHVHDRHHHVIRGAEARHLDRSIYRNKNQNRDHRIQDSKRFEERSETDRGPAKIWYNDFQKVRTTSLLAHVCNTRRYSQVLPQHLLSTCLGKALRGQVTVLERSEDDR